MVLLNSHIIKTNNTKIVDSFALLNIMSDNPWTPLGHHNDC